MMWIYYINLACYVIALVLHIDLLAGFLAQAILGILHIITALFLYTQYPRFSARGKKHMNLYTTFVILFFVVYITIKKTDFPIDMTVGLVCLAVFPMAIGGYFMYVLNVLLKEQESNPKKPLQNTNA